MSVVVKNGINLKVIRELQNNHQLYKEYHDLYIEIQGNIIAYQEDLKASELLTLQKILAKLAILIDMGSISNSDFFESGISMSSEPLDIIFAQAQNEIDKEILNSIKNYSNFIVTELKNSIL